MVLPARRLLRHVVPFVSLALAALAPLPAQTPNSKPDAPHTFTIGERDFLLDGAPLQIRCGEMHFARVPREYWQHRLKLLRAMGMNAVCAYLFWNFHEPRPGEFNWSGERDVAEFCRLAQQEGLWVVLRPGPYACAEWEMGGLPWWLLKHDDIKLRTRDPRFLEASARWFNEVGRVLGPLQVTQGGPILLVQVENEYGFYGTDIEYMGAIRQQVLDAGFKVPLFACNPPHKLKDGYRSDLFQVVNFGRDPQGGFKALLEVQPTGPLMCGEFYPGWFDTWGQPHHLGDTPRYLADLEYMLKSNASFSIYMAHGGTTFGLWAGADRPFKPDTSSYDYDAPISEAGWTGEKFEQTRELMKRYLLPGESVPDAPPRNPTTAVPEFAATEIAPVFKNLPAPELELLPRTMEAYDQAAGLLVYRLMMLPGAAGVLEVGDIHDFGWVFVDGVQVGVLDRRHQTRQVTLPARTQPVTVDILVYAMGRVNFGWEVHDRKGLHAPVRFLPDHSEEGVRELRDWQVFSIDLSDGVPKGMAWSPLHASAPAAAASSSAPTTRAFPSSARTGVSAGPALSAASAKATPAPSQPAFYRAFFTLDSPADTFLDLRQWGKGVVWLNGRCLGRFWNIGPTQTMYVPAPWIRKGQNEVVVLDLIGPARPILAGLAEPILDELRPGLDFNRPAGFGAFTLESVSHVHEGEFDPGSIPQDIRFSRTVQARQFCLESLSAHDGKPFAAIAELDLLDEQNRPLPHTRWTIVYVDSEETKKEDGSALNAINGQTADHWHSGWSEAQPPHPHRIVIDFGDTVSVRGFRYTPRAGGPDETGRIQKFRAYLGQKLGGAQPQ